ncbi:MAG: Wzz/FepE/Etk N-terminal domain-containing protein [Candidatus Sulfotelmatobacter sp.]
MSQQATKTRQEFLPEPAFRGLEDPDVPGPRPAGRLTEYLRLVWRARRAVSRTALAGLALGTLLAFLLPKQYQSTVQLMPPDNQSGSSAMLAALSAKAGAGIGAMAGDLIGGNSTGAMFIGILRSRTVEDRLVGRFALKRVYGEKLAEDARNRLANNTGISEDHKSGIISLSVVDRDPGRAAAIAEAYVDELERLVSDLSTSSAHRERIFLEERLKVVKQELDRDSAEFSRFASQNAAINIPEQGKAMVEAAAALQGQLIGAESELKGLSEIYAPGNVRVRSLQARVSELRRQLNQLDGDSRPSPGDGLAEKRSAEQRPPYPTIRELPLLGVTYADLLRRTRIQETVFETLTQQYELAKVQEAKETPSVKILDSASLPERKVFPPRLLIMFWGAALGLVAAALSVGAGERWRGIDSRDPRKMLLREMLQPLEEFLSHAGPNGSHVRLLLGRLGMRGTRLPGAADAQPHD